MISTRVPFVHGGAEALCDDLVTALQALGHEAEAFRLPFTADPPERLIDEMLIARSIRVRNVDRAIALRFPAYLVPHPNKVLWLVDAYRHTYDGAGRPAVRSDERSRQIRRAVRGADIVAFAEAQKLFATTKVAADRLHRASGKEATVVPAPVSGSDEWPSVVERLLA